MVQKFFFPEDKLIGVFLLLEREIFHLSEIENELTKMIKFYYKSTWIFGETKLSTFSSENAINNGAETTYHKTLKLFIIVHHSNLWKFLSDIDYIILDNEIECQKVRTRS